MDERSSPSVRPSVRLEASSFKPASSNLLLSSTPMPHVKREMGDCDTTASPVKFRCMKSLSASSSETSGEWTLMSSYESSTFESSEESCVKSTKPKLAQDKTDESSLDIEVEPNFWTGGETPMKIENVFSDLSITEYLSTHSPIENVGDNIFSKRNKNCVPNLDTRRQEEQNGNIEKYCNESALSIELDTVRDSSNFVPPTAQKSDPFFKFTNVKKLNKLKSNANEDSDVYTESNEDSLYTEYHRNLPSSANASAHDISSDEDIYLSSRSVSSESKTNETNSRSYEDETVQEDTQGSSNATGSKDSSEQGKFTLYSRNDHVEKPVADTEFENDRQVAKSETRLQKEEMLNGVSTERDVADQLEYNNCSPGNSKSSMKEDICRNLCQKNECSQMDSDNCVKEKTEEFIQESADNFKEGDITEMGLSLVTKSYCDTSKEEFTNRKTPQNEKCLQDPKCDGETRILSLDQNCSPTNSVKSTNEVQCAKCGNPCIEIDQNKKSECIKLGEESKNNEDLTIKPNINIKLVWDLFEVDNIISRNILLLLSDLKNGATFTEILSHFRKEEISRPVIKLSRDIMTFLNAALNANIIQLKASRYILKETAESHENLATQENVENVKDTRTIISHSTDDLNLPGKMKLRNRKNDDESAQQEKKKKLPEKKDETRKDGIIKKQNDGIENFSREHVNILKSKTLSNEKSVVKNVTPERVTKVLMKDSDETRKDMKPSIQIGIKRSQTEETELPKRKILKSAKDADKTNQPETGKKLREKDKNETKPDSKIEKQNSKENIIKKSTKEVVKGSKTMKQKNTENLRKSSGQSKNKKEKNEPENVKVLKQKVTNQRKSESENANSKIPKQKKSLKPNGGKKSIAKDCMQDKFSVKVSNDGHKAGKIVSEATHKMKLRGSTK